MRLRGAADQQKFPADHQWSADHRLATAALQCRILSVDGITQDAQRRRFYEKPCRKRQREAYETCRRIYNAEMARKIQFLMRKNRQDPWLGC